MGRRYYSCLWHPAEGLYCPREGGRCGREGVLDSSGSGQHLSDPSVERGESRGRGPGANDQGGESCPASQSEPVGNPNWSAQLPLHLWNSKRASPVEWAWGDKSLLHNRDRDSVVLLGQKPEVALLSLPPCPCVMEGSRTRKVATGAAWQPAGKAAVSRARWPVVPSATGQNMQGRDWPGRISWPQGRVCRAGRS